MGAPRLAAMLAAGLLTVAAAGCGGSDPAAPQVPRPPADVAVPESSQAPAAAASANGKSSSSDSTSPDSTSTPDPSTSGSTGTGTGTTTGDTASGGTTSP